MLVALVVVAIRTYKQREAAHRAAHDARLSAMAQTYLAAARKKKAADAAAAAKAGAAAQAMETPASAALRDERECPFCAEPILKKARVCKHCRREVDPLL